MFPWSIKRETNHFSIGSTLIIIIIIYGVVMNITWFIINSTYNEREGASSRLLSVRVSAEAAPEEGVGRGRRDHRE